MELVQIVEINKQEKSTELELLNMFTVPTLFPSWTAILL
jgi:hypothetical protein